MLHGHHEHRIDRSCRERTTALVHDATLRKLRLKCPVATFGHPWPYAGAIDGPERQARGEAPHARRMVPISITRVCSTVRRPSPPHRDSEGEPRQMPDLGFIRTSYYIAALTEGIARIQYLPRVLHETRGQALLAPRAFSREQWSRL